MPILTLNLSVYNRTPCLVDLTKEKSRRLAHRQRPTKKTQKDHNFSQTGQHKKITKEKQS